MGNRTREYKEGKNLFGDPRFARDAWRSVGLAILKNPATKGPMREDKDGNESLSSEIERYAYNDLCRDIKEILKEDRSPTELEMILACQIRKARYDTQAAVFVRDTVGAKPVDESKLDATVNNPFENLTDEELAIIAQHREQIAAIAEQSKQEQQEPQGIEDKGVIGCPGPLGGSDKLVYGCDASLCSKEKREACASRLHREGYEVVVINEGDSNE